MNMVSFEIVLEKFKDEEVRNFVTWRILPVAVIAGTIWFCRKKGVGLRVKTFMTNRVMKKIHNSDEIVKRKQELFSKLKEQSSPNKKLAILEIGVGSGSNFDFYPPGSQVICSDPNPTFEAYINQKCKESGIEALRFIEGRAEQLADVGDSSVDAVVSTFVFCHIQDADKALDEIKRVLKPKGVFYFLEHVQDNKESLIRRVQRALHSITGSTKMVKETAKSIQNAGFSQTEINNFYCNTILFMIKPMIWGRAIK